VNDGENPWVNDSENPHKNGRLESQKDNWPEESWFGNNNDGLGAKILNEEQETGIGNNFRQWRAQFTNWR